MKQLIENNTKQDSLQVSNLKCQIQYKQDELNKITQEKDNHIKQLNSEIIKHQQEQSTLNYFDEVNFYFVFTYLTYEIEIVCLILLKHLTSLIKIIYLLICF